MPDTDEPDCPKLEHGRIIPAFTLPGADGMPHSPWDYKQREHLVLLFIASPISSSSQQLLAAYAQRYPEFREEDCAILAITAEPVIHNLKVQEALHSPFPLLSDTTGKVIAQYTRWNATTRQLTPAIMLADRYSALYEQWHAEHEEALPPPQPILESLQYLNKLCTP